jgi:hypothetical protein
MEMMEMMKMMNITNQKTIAFIACALLVTSTVAAAQAFAPLVTIRVTLPDGRTEEVTAPESGLARLTAKDGTEFGFRPTVLDSKPWNRVVVAIFRTPTASAPSQLLGEIEVKTGSAAVESRTSPAFKIAVVKVSPPAGGGTTNE